MEVTNELILAVACLTKMAYDLSAFNIAGYIMIQVAIKAYELEVNEARKTIISTIDLPEREENNIDYYGYCSDRELFNHEVQAFGIANELISGY